MFSPSRTNNRVLLRAVVGLLLGSAAFGCASPVTSSERRRGPAVSSAKLAPVLLDRPLVAWREFILPESPDAGATSIEWWTSFESGLGAAVAAKKPMLLWLMNGHPLGCT